MNNKPIKLIDTRLILLLIIGINLIFFLIYYFAYPDIPFWEKAWEYLSSAIFTLVTGSLIIPLIISILEKRYKFMENIQRQREEKQKMIEEQKRASRNQTITDTIGMWQELYNLTSELIYFEPKKGSKTEINNYVNRLFRFPSTAEVTVNKWAHQFPNLENETFDTFLEFVNIVYQSSLSIALFIQRGLVEKEVADLQNMLFLILDQTKSIVHHRMMDIFKFSAKLLELEDSDGDKGKIWEYRETIKLNAEGLKDWANGISDHNDKYDNFLAPNSGPEIDAIRKTARSIQIWLKEDKKRQVFEAKEFTDLQTQFYNINFEDRVSAAAIPYTIEYMKALADWLSFESACTYIYNRTHRIW
jgi:hypothetical protein